jgi:hypothetical protein
MHALTSKSFQSAVSSPAVAWWQLPTTNVLLTLASRTIPVPQLPVSYSKSSKRPNCKSPLTAHEFTPLYSTQLAPLTVLLIRYRQGPDRKHRYSVACAENTTFQPVHWPMLGVCFLAEDIVYRVTILQRFYML